MQPSLSVLGLIVYQNRVVIPQAQCEDLFKGSLSVWTMQNDVYGGQVYADS